MDNRRDFLSLYLTGGAAAMLLAGCTAQQVSDTEKKVADLINQVQAGVAKACTTVGKLIPTANSVIAVLLGIVGSTSVVGATATMIATAIADIAAIGCAGQAPHTATTAKGVPVSFY